MKAHIIKDGEYKGMRFTKGLVYSVSDPTLAELIGMGIALDNRPKVTVDASEVKAPKGKKVTKPKKFSQVAEMVKIPMAIVSVPGLTTSKETKEEKFQNPTEE